MSELSAGGLPRSNRPKRAWRRVRFAVGIALGGVALWAVSGQGGELAGASAELAHLDAGWLLLAIAVEALSLVAFARLDQRLLGCGGVRSSTARFSAISFAAGAIASSLPAGPLVASAFGFRQFRRLGASEALAAWALLATLVFSALGLALLATAGVFVAERQGAAFDLVGVTVAVLAVTIAGTAAVYQRRTLARLLGWTLKVSNRVTGFPRRPGDDVISSFVASMSQVNLGKADLLSALMWSVANWALDCACLVFAFLAVGAGVPWRGLLLAYGAGQLAANLPVTPGGLGVVEGSLVIALVAFGGGQVSTVAAVLLYRIVSFWGYLPVGWLVWAGLTWHNGRADKLASLTAEASALRQVPVLAQDQSAELA
ncbi:MAG: lysylphosphatidylglycerol synthase transmembrane domain-containing protein [Acidimicrobiales bacterium]